MKKKNRFLVIEAYSSNGLWLGCKIDDDNIRWDTFND